MGFIYSASIFAPEHHHGVVIPICRSLPTKLPEGVSGRILADHPLRPLLAPSAALLREYKARQSAHGEVMAVLKALGYSGSGSFLDHLEVCGSFERAIDTPEPSTPPCPEAWYISEYRSQLANSVTQVREGIEALVKGQDDFTLVCWEKAGDFCHRNLVMQCVGRWHPKNWGGKDTGARCRH